MATLEDAVRYDRELRPRALPAPAASSSEEEESEEEGEKKEGDSRADRREVLVPFPPVVPIEAWSYMALERPRWSIPSPSQSADPRGARRGGQRGRAPLTKFVEFEPE